MYSGAGWNRLCNGRRLRGFSATKKKSHYNYYDNNENYDDNNEHYTDNGPFYRVVCRIHFHKIRYIVECFLSIYVNRIVKLDNN